MQVIVNGRHIDVTDALRNYAESKVKKIEKYLPGTTEAVVTLSVQKYRHNAEILIKVNGLLIQADDETGEMYSAIDKVMDKIEKALKKLTPKERALIKEILIALKNQRFENLDLKKLKTCSRGLSTSNGNPSQAVLIYLRYLDNL